MKKEIFKQEMAEMKRKVERMEQNSLLELQTANFLLAEGDRLDKIVESEDSNFQEKEDAMNALDVIMGKIEFERRVLKPKNDETKEIYNKIKVLNMLEQYGLVEE